MSAVPAPCSDRAGCPRTHDFNLHPSPATDGQFVERLRRQIETSRGRVSSAPCPDVEHNHAAEVRASHPRSARARRIGPGVWAGADGEWRHGQHRWSQSSSSVIAPIRDPNVFVIHEVWHAIAIAGAVSHFAMVCILGCGDRSWVCPAVGPSQQATRRRRPNAPLP